MRPLVRRIFYHFGGDFPAIQHVSTSGSQHFSTSLRGFRSVVNGYDTLNQGQVSGNATARGPTSCTGLVLFVDSRFRGNDGWEELGVRPQLQSATVQTNSVLCRGEELVQRAQSNDRTAES